ncbi:biotin carboxylase [Salinisphaera hydrothermalis]|uniref:Biotin carboxylase-like protein n=1 Tax=Salinisphaera hydrothermalis (strain C41B8) TaxID=1304275 RepID=A0A084IMQ9_SALHC|nr:biotin carboxylase [Salinisphaera hydrothermalis]KEZ77993.1 biotin carboxylase-like protein [Salinisphaera hydrothermalis C41B8]
MGHPNTDATQSTQTLHGLSDIRRFFRRNETPIYFISATNFNLLGADEWVHHFKYINYIDCFDGQHPNLFVPPEIAHKEFQSIEDINNYLLEHKAVADYVHSRGPGKALFLMFDETTEQLARELDLEVCLPPASLRQHLDDKLVTTRIAEAAGIKCVPNVMGTVDSYETLRRLSADLGDELVVQTAFGDSGHTTFMISDEEDWAEHADEIVGAGDVKIMKRIKPRGTAVEACVTRHGTIVAPIMTELVGFPELTPYEGGWCGNEIFANAFTPELRDQARDATLAMGECLKREGYRGYFELDFLIDRDTDELYLGEMNPRITGASSITNHAAFALSDMPLFMFHLLEWMGVDYTLDVDEINARWADPVNIDCWGQLVIKHTVDSVGVITQAPPTGIWWMDGDGNVNFSRYDTHRYHVESEAEALFVRIAGIGDYWYEGADLGILVTRGRLMTDDFELNERARAWIDGITAHFRASAPTAENVGHLAPGALQAHPAPGSFKLL